MSGDIEHFQNRADLLDHIWEKMKPPSQVKNSLIFFGGISTKLRREEADDHYIQWLTSNPEAKLFICYETGENARKRDKMLNWKKIKGSPDYDTSERMERKEREVKELRDRLFKKLNATNPGLVKDRLHFIALKALFLTNYVIAADNDLFFTPLIAKRSSETISFNVSHSSRYLCDFLQYIQYYIEVTELNHEMDSKDLPAITNHKNIKILHERINKILATIKMRNENI